MQYQQIILFIDISVIVLILTFIKDYYWRRILIIGTVCAYVLAAILPYLLACTSLNQTILFYALAMGAVLFLGYDQYKSRESRTNNEAVTEAASGSEASIPADGESVVQSDKQAAESKFAAENDSIVGDEPITNYGVTEVSSVDETIADLETGHEDKAEDTGSALESPSASDATPLDITETHDSTGDDQLAVTAEEQPAVAVQPSTVKTEEQSAVIPEETPAFGTEEKRATIAEESPTGIEGGQPAVSDEVPLAFAVEEPMSVTAEEQPADIADEQPTVSDEIPLSTAADDQPTVTAEEMPTDDQTIEKPKKPWGALNLQSETTVIDAVTENIEGPKTGEAAAGVQASIEDLIIKSFEARARGDYFDTLTILETILEQDPPEDVVNIILDDVEVLFAKLAP